MVQANVIGLSGFALQAQASEAGQPDGLVRRLIEDAFAQWGARGICEITGRFSFVDVQRQVAERWRGEGEVLILQLTGNDSNNNHGYALRLLEVERLPVQHSQDLKNGQRAVRGVEVDDLNRVVAYWLNLDGIGKTSLAPATLTRVSADRVLHLDKPELCSVASGLGVTYHGLANDLAGVNFSGIRSDTPEEGDDWLVLQNWFVETFLRPVYLKWLYCALTAGRIVYPNGNALPIAKYDKFAAHTWRAHRWGWLDPLKTSRRYAWR